MIFNPSHEGQYSCPIHGLQSLIVDLTSGVLAWACVVQVELIDSPEIVEGCTMRLRIPQIIVESDEDLMSEGESSTDDALSVLAGIANAPIVASELAALERIWGS